MKNFALVCIVLLVTGCAQVRMMLVKHDPVLVDHYVKTAIAVEDSSCEVKGSIKGAVVSARFMAKYAEFRNDPQQESAKAVLINLQKAETSDGACGRWMDLTKQRLQVLGKAWSTR